MSIPKKLFFGTNAPIRSQLGWLLGLFFLSNLPVWAQAPDYQFSKVSMAQGLSNNQVNSILRDRKGFVWIGTLAGLNRYDGYSCKVYQHNYRDSTTLGNNHVTKLFEDPVGNIWVVTVNGISIFNPLTESFFPNPERIFNNYSIPCQKITHIYRDQKDTYWFLSDTAGIYQYDPRTRRTKVLTTRPQPGVAALLTNQVAAVQSDSEGNAWILHTNGQLEYINSATQRVTYRNATLFERDQGKTFNYHMYRDSEGDLWIYSDEGQGLVCFHVRQQTFSQFHTHSAVAARLNNNIIRGVVEENGYIWVGTDHGGINLIHKRQRTVSYLVQDPKDERSLSQNSVTSLYKDNQGIIWIGTYKKGVNYYHRDVFKFSFFRHQTGNPQSLPFNDINRIIEDPKGNLWIGTNGDGLVYFDRQKGSYTQYRHDPNNPASLSSNVVVSLCVDHQQKLWVGTYTGGLNYFDGQRFTHYQYDPNRPTSLSNNNVWEIMEDSEHHLWIATNGGGLNLFDREKNVFYHYRDQDFNSIRSNYVTTLLQDRQGNVWIGTAYGLNKMDRSSGRFIHYIMDNNNPESISNNNISATLEDSRGWIWVGTEEGLNIFDKKTGKFRALRKEDGLPDNTIQGILEDDQHTIWLSTANGLGNIRIRNAASVQQATFLFKNYHQQDGLQDNAFNPYVAYRTRAGELIFGGANGFNLFRPDQLHLAKIPPPVKLTELQLFDKPVRVGEKISGDILLSQALSDTKAITLRHDQNIFSIEFVALDYFHPDKNQYAYTLEGFTRGWSLSDGQSRKATYMNLPPGEYVFRVKTGRNTTEGKQSEAMLKITILPPFWKTKVAYALYILFILGALALARVLVLKRAQINFRLEQERQEALRMHEMDLMKIKFFTNVSHEFKTPLSLILSPLESIIKKPDEGDLQKLVPMVYRNARRLLNLINQLLDFRKMEMQQLKLHPTSGDIIQFIREATDSFSDISEKKQIALTFQANIDHVTTFFDQDKLEKILFNLLSNAFKFTPGQGNVTVEVTFPDTNSASDTEVQWLRISVSDTGIGIPSDKTERIFERFFQHDTSGSLLNQGSGIGLSITKEFVRLHEGTIEVKSEPEKGSCFIVRLPVRQIDPGLAHVPEQAPTILGVERLYPPEVQAGNGKKGREKAVVLLVEDNEDFRFYLKDNLKSQYTILEATNGKEGWQLAAATLPDLVVSDVMMPEMNGIELCRQLKSNRLTAHISVILLTARSTDEQKLEGLEVGIDDYMTKPFNFEILHVRIKNLLARKASERKDLFQPMEVDAAQTPVLSHEEKLVRKAYVLVEKNIANPEYSVEELGRDIGISRASLYKKLLSHTGKTPIEFIRVMRLRRAAELLEGSQLTVSEVAYQVGFNNPKYFAKYFKTEYNLLPSHYIAQKRKV